MLSELTVNVPFAVAESYPLFRKAQRMDVQDFTNSLKSVIDSEKLNEEFGAPALNIVID